MRWISILLIALVIYSCGETPTTAGNSSIAALQDKIDKDVVSPELGKDVYSKFCKVCHGESGQLGIGGAADLSLSLLDSTNSVQVILKGKGAMVGYESKLSSSQIESVRRHLLLFKKD